MTDTWQEVGMQAVSICDEWKLLLVAVHRLFIEVSSFVAEHKL